MKLLADALGLWTFFDLVTRALAIYDPLEPHLTENFDPAEASPAGVIFCSGPLPPWKLPRFPEWDWDPNTFTLQELCAKPQYGGKAPGQHLGAFCMDDHTLL
ncbi:MAG: hypothetical protein M1817_002677 [Caeruleum heppii]|nr:MAG: hypothetical protein M1817_002677 [Caeruleum heppii]